MWRASVVAHVRCSLAAGTVLVLAGMSSCDQNHYEIKEDKTGRIVRLDRRTGEVAVLEGDKLVRMKAPHEQRIEQERADRLASAKSWPDHDLAQLDKSKATLVTAWRGGQLHYQFTLRPEPKSFREGSLTGLTLALSDPSGFKTVEIDIPRAKLLRVVNPNGDAWGLSLDGSVSCSQDDYERSASWTISWRRVR